MTRQVVFLASLGSVFFFASQPSRCQAGDRSSLSDVLKLEANGEQVDRRACVDFTDTTQPEIENQTAWQAGLIKKDQSWQQVEKLSQTSDLYEKKRAEFDAHPDKHLILARWCRLQNMDDQARAHYFGVLTSDENNKEARAFLGHILCGVQWASKTDLAAKRLETQRFLDQLEKTVPPVKKIVEDLTSSVPKRMTRAFQSLERMDASSNLAGLEFFAANIDDNFAKPLVRKIATLKSEQACHALVRIAIARPSGEARKMSSQAIAEYPEHFYVPMLLSMLATETKVTNQLVMQPNGTIGLETMFTNELQNRKHLKRAQKLVSVVAAFSLSHEVKLKTTTFGDISYWSNFWSVPVDSPKHYGKLSTTKDHGVIANSDAQMVYFPRQLGMVAARNLFEQGKQSERLNAAQNRILKEKTNNVCSLLRSTTQTTELGDDPKAWWSWWIESNERYEGRKPTLTAYRRQREKIMVSSRSYSSSKEENAYDFGKMTIQYSCLVPGTTVQTATGLVAIEDIQIGDLVASQNVETSELTLKPVILTTVRPPKSTIKIVLKDETIEATGGHYWFVSGKGWLKTRDLASGMVLHTASGSAEIQEVNLNPDEQPTYNLVVDGFHTYFVGESRVLSYDNTLLKPTLRKVPGF